MAKIRHIAYRAVDVEAMANFFVEALEMTITQRRKNRAIDLSDGTINVTVLPVRGGVSDESARHGIDHIGVSVEDDEKAGKRLEAAGATKLGSVPLGSSAHYEF
jgi:catechol 2,3-dioxygenase-like lactoylglutathione lyase family enzyme